MAGGTGQRKDTVKGGGNIRCPELWYRDAGRLQPENAGLTYAGYPSVTSTSIECPATPYVEFAWMTGPLPSGTMSSGDGSDVSTARRQVRPPGDTGMRKWIGSRQALQTM